MGTIGTSGNYKGKDNDEQGQYCAGALKSIVIHIINPAIGIVPPIYSKNDANSTPASYCYL
jgi:hypothetical protein